MSPDQPSAPEAPPAASAARWHLRLLGGFELADGRSTLHRLPSRAITLLLARLAMGADREHGREELIELLWPAVALDVGRNRLRQALSALRSVLEPAEWPGAPVLLADRRAVRLAPDGLRCDVQNFQQALAAGDSAAAQRLYRGELLPGYFDEWVLEERRHLAAQFETLVPSLGGTPASPASNATAAAIAGTAAPSAAEPQSVRTNTATTRHHLPLYLSRLLGFEAAGAELAAAVRSHRFVVLRGPGGAGKTRLAVEVARLLAGAQGPAGQQPPDFEWVSFVPLAACTSRQAMLDAVLLALRQEGAAGAADVAERLALALAGRRALLVLDNFEQLVDVGRADVASWLDRLPQLHLLVTSRRVLGLDGEHEQALSALPLPEPEAPLQEHAQNPATALFADRARAVRADFHLGERNHQLVAAIVRELHGLPLAIELAAARLRSVSLVDMLAMLRGSRDQPGGALALLARSGPRGADDARHASMLRVVEWGWQLLRAEERAALAALSSFHGGATLQAMVLMQQQAAAEVAALLDDLVASSVAYAREGSDGHSRFHAFEPVREYLRLQQGEAGRRAAAQAHLQAMAAWARGLGRAPALDSFRDELPNLLAALATALASGQPALALQMGLDVDDAMQDVALPPSGLQALRQACAALQAAIPAPTPDQVQLLALAHAQLAERSFESAEREAAALHAQQAQQLVAADAPQRARVLYAAARTALRITADMPAAERLIDEALPLARARGQLDMEARLLTLQSVIATRRQDHAADIALKQQALQLWQRHGAPTRVAGATVSLAISLGFAHRVHEQLQLLQGVRETAAGLGQTTLLAFALSVQGYALADLRRWDEAASSYLECLRTAWPVSGWREWFYGLWNLPRTLAHLRRPEPAGLLMAFADVFYSQRFGTLGWEDARERRRTRRLLRVQLGREAEDRLWQRGALLSMGEAMSLACAEAAAASVAGTAPAAPAVRVTGVTGHATPPP